MISPVLKLFEGSVSFHFDFVQNGGSKEILFQETGGHHEDRPVVQFRNHVHTADELMSGSRFKSQALKCPFPHRLRYRCCQVVISLADLAPIAIQGTSGRGRMQYGNGIHERILFQQPGALIAIHPRQVNI